METFWLIVSISLIIIGLAGTVIPMLPGIPLIFAGFLVWGIASAWRDFSVQVLIILGVVTLVVTFLDYYAGGVGARKYGSSKSGIWGAIIGGIIGVLVFNIPGLVIGPFVGAVSGELLAGKSQKEAWRAGWGAFVGVVAGNLLKVITALVMSGLFFYYLIV